MHIHVVPNRGSKPAVLLRESYREGNRVKKRTLANLSKLPMDQVESIRRVLKGEKLVSAEDVFEIVEGGSKSHGDVEAVLSAMKQLRFDSLLAARASRERNLVVAMVASRVLRPQSKLATTTWWHGTTLPELLKVQDADENDLYDAMDWLLERQERVERKLAQRHLQHNGLALYDLSSSYFEGTSCSLAKIGHSRDGKKNKLQVNYGLLTNKQGVPISVSVFDGNTGDPKTTLPQIEKIRKDFGIERFVFIGDRGTVAQKQIDASAQTEGVDWITALRHEGIRKLANSGAIQLGLFDQRNIVELSHPDFPNERLVACRNPELAKHRTYKRQQLLAATTEELARVKAMVERQRIQGREKIETCIIRIINGYKVRKYYNVKVEDDGFTVEIDTSALQEDINTASSGDSELRKKRYSRAERHIQAIESKLDCLRRRISRGMLFGKDKIGMRVGKVFNKYKVEKHFNISIGDDYFNFEIDPEKVAAEAALDGIYVIRTSLSEEQMTPAQVVRSYKQLSEVERAFRSLKSIELQVRPIRHRLEDRVRAHIFLCMLAYYVQWHMKQAWRPLLFADEELDAKQDRDPVAPAQRSESALRKVRSRKLRDGTRVHSFSTLMHHLKRIVRNTCRGPGAAPQEPTFEVTTSPDPKQLQAYELLKSIRL